MSERRSRGFYERRVFPWINDTLAGRAFADIRREALSDARGRVVEIGFGSGMNLPYYPDAVTSIVAVEPNSGMLDRAGRRIAASRIPVVMLENPAERLRLDSGSMDTAVSVLTLCSVGDPAAVLAELRRVLTPNGRLIVVEHGLSDEPNVAKWQHRLNSVQNVVACGCHLTRSPKALVEHAGFRFERVRQFCVPGAPRTHGWVTVGTAVPA
ncbi:MAG TPA: class I SAM-dependent methyltransferase [Vicinamibacterales bacterium]|jgi:ubiquinone/menaquinone biosynthesis C-methylase UbiE|nr:class I SAM-dependent methyltransferase [Vicinamibacterales bacterium]